MNITAENTGTLQQRIHIEIRTEDYKPKVNSELKKIAQRVVIPGFRAGKAPAGMVQRTYGAEITINTINDLINTALDKHITENKLNIFGYPMPDPDQEPADFDKNDTLEFRFDIGLMPDVNIDLATIKGEKYDVSLDEATYEKTIADLRANVGRTYPKIAEATDSVAFDIHILDNNGGEAEQEITLMTVPVPISEIADKAMCAQLVGATPSDKFDGVPEKIFGTAEKMAAAIEPNKNDDYSLTQLLAMAEKNSEFQVKQIVREGVAELNQDFFDRTMGKDVVTTAEEFETKARAEMIEIANKDAEQMAINAAAEEFFKGLNFEMPDDFLMRLFKNQEKEQTVAEIEASYPQIVDSLRRTIAVDSIFRDNNVQITTEDLISHASMQISQFFAQYNIPLDPKKAREQALSMIKTEKEREKIAEEVRGIKLYSLLREKMDFTLKPITMSEFNKM